MTRRPARRVPFASGVASIVAALLACTVAGSAHAQRSVTARAVQLFGAHGATVVAGKPDGAQLSALVELPPAIDAASLGLFEVAPGIAVVRGDAARIAGFVTAHGELPFELAPPLHLALDLAVPYVTAERERLGFPGSPGAIDGKGVYVGVVDTGVDIFHPDLRNADGSTRIAWLLDFSQPARPDRPDDVKYGARVFSRADLDVMVRGERIGGVPDDLDGHGTHVTGIAAGNGGDEKKYVGVAPSADLIIVRATRDSGGGIDEADAATGARFVFDMASADGHPAVVNLSLGSQFGPHDGTSTFERALVALVDRPGRAIVVAASNEGGTPIHTSVRVSPHAKFDVPFRLDGSDGKGRGYHSAQVFLWLNWRDGGDVHVSLRGPGGDKWLDDVSPGDGFESHPTGDVLAQIVNDVHDAGVIPRGTHGAIVTVRGGLPVGDYTLELRGDGLAEAWLQGVGEAGDGAGAPYFQRGGQIEGTIGVPASADGVISIGCVDLRTTLKKSALATLDVPNARPGTRCFFSSAGPSALGTLRPDVVAPGYFVVSALAHAAFVANGGADFTPDQIVDSTHAALSGTSMSSPFGAGAVALLFQRDPTLTQEQARLALQAGSRALADDRDGGPGVRDYGKGAGILDVVGAMTALDRRAAPPDASRLQLRLAASYVDSAATAPLWVVGLARDAVGRPADVPGGLRPVADGVDLRAPVEHPMPGLYRFAVTARASGGIATATVGFEGGGFLATRAVPIAADRWDARDGVGAGGGCTLGVSPSPSRSRSLGPIALALLALVGLRRRRAAHSPS